VKILGHERGQFLRVGIEIGQQPFSGGAKFGVGWVLRVPQHLFVQEQKNRSIRFKLGE
jgi:hypothetical protein